MQKALQDKRVVLTLAVLALLSLMLLTNALSRMDFLPSQPIGGGGSSDPVVRQPLDIEGMLKTAAEVPFWKQLVFWAVLFMLLLLITSLLSPELRKQLIYAFLRTASFALVLFYVIKKQPQLFASFLSRIAGVGQNLPTSLEVDPLPAPVFEPPQETSWLSFAVTLGIILAVVLFIWWANRLWVRIRERNASSQPLDEIAAIARDSLSDLKAGHNYDNAIVECYDRMSDVIAKKQGLQRAHTMTPSEFAVRLTRAGLPRDPVQRLTGLFESVRYGKQPAGQAEINQAIHSLTSILDYCGEAASHHAA
jgi:hypothetical protein